VQRGADVRAGSYTTSRGHRVSAFGVRHPQGALAAELRAAVLFGLAESCV
jgi:hypothetical protein